MRIYSNVTEQDLIYLRKLAEQQKEQRALKIKNRILKQRHDVKLAENLSPITKKLDEVKESTQKLGDIVKESNTPHLALGKTLTQQSIEIIEEVIYDVELKNTLNKKKESAGFFNIEERDNCDTFWNGFPIGKNGGNKPKTNEKIHIITPDIRKVLTETSNIPLKKLNDEHRDTFIKISKSLDFKNYKAIRGESKSSRYKNSKSIFKKRNLERSRSKNYHTIQHI